MDTGRFKIVQPEQLVHDERKRAQAASTAQSSRAQAQTGGRKRVSARSKTGARRGNDRESASVQERSRRRVSQQGPKEGKRRPSALLIVIIAILLALVIGIAQLCSSATPIEVSVNGTHYTLRGAKTLQTAIKESGVPLNPGDLISLNGNILQRHQGNPFYAMVNDEETVDPDLQLHNGDVIVLSDGKDIVEDYDAVEETVPFGVSAKGSGPIHTFTEGSEGTKEIRTGRLSGEVVEKLTVEPQDVIETWSEIGVGNDKVIALTFDDGPSLLYTEEILDILAENEAKATFFCIGTEMNGDGAALVQRAAQQGCQICTHGYSNLSATGGKIAELSADDQVAEIQRGMQSITDVLGYEPSRYVRIGGDSMYGDVVAHVVDYIDAEIGWSLDTGDWVYMTEKDIYDVLMSAKAGDIVRMHDGGDHQDVTAAALKKALPKLKAKGFSFITIDELMAYSSPAG